MRNWAFALAASIIVVAGCSGGGGNGGGGGGGGGNTGESTAFATIPNVPGLLQNVYLTGQGRALGDLVAVIRRVTVNDAGGQVQTLLNPFLRLQLNGYTHQFISMNVPTSVGRTFDHYNLEIQALDVDNGDGTFTEYSGRNQPLVSQQFPANFRILPGRQTSMTVRLDDSMFVLNGGNYDFDTAQFETVNYSQVGLNPPMMNGFLSDYVAFDLRNLQDTPPDFPDGSGTAEVLYINGDNFALGIAPPGAQDQATSDPEPFFVLTPAGYVEGQHVGERTAIDPNTGRSAIIPGTYSLVQIDPRDPLNPAAKITALQGIYKTYTHVFASIGTNPQGFEILAFPSTQDDGVDDIVLFNVSGGSVTHMYFGQLDMNAGTIDAFPIQNVTNPANTTGEITGTVTNLDSTDVTHVHSGHYTLNPTNLPPTFSTSGRFVVYRR